MEVDSKECQELRRVYPQATVVYGNWVGSGRDGDGCCEIGIVEGRWEEGSGEEKKKTGKRIQASWRCRPKTLSSKKSKIGKMLKITPYLNEELPDLLVEVKTSGQSYCLTTPAMVEELSDEEEQEFYYLNTLGIRHCDRDEKGQSLQIPSFREGVWGVSPRRYR